MRRMLSLGVLLALLIGTASAALFESGTKDAQPIVLYGKTSAGAIVPVKVDADGIVDSSGGGGTISDDAYGAGWNGDTTAGASKNALYDKIETIVAGGLDFALDSSTSGNIVYVGCSDDIQTAIDAATAGDTLVLGSCTYSVSSTLTVSKALTITGQSMTTTKIDFGATASSLFTITVSDTTIANMTLTGTAVTTFIAFSGTAGTMTTNNSVKAVSIIAPNMNISTVPTGILYTDSSGFVDNVYLKIINAGTGRVIGLSKYTASTSEADSTLYVNRYTCDIENTNASFTGEMRCTFHWNNGASVSPSNSYAYFYELNSKCRYNTSASSGKTECFQAQGPNVAPNPGVTGGLYNYVYGGVIDGFNNEYCAAANCRDARVEDYAFADFFGTTFGSGYTTTSNNGTITKNGIVFAGGIQGTGPRGNYNISTAPSVISLTGGVGGTNTQTGTKTGGNGGGVSITGGLGAEATAATLTGTGGSGGGFSLTGGNGSDQTAATATTNVGGAGGGFAIIAGDGGAASGASGTDTGGAGGKIRLVPGSGGTGTDASGAVGYILLGENSAGTEVGWVGIQEDTRLGSTKFMIEGNDSSADGDDFIAAFYEGDITPEASAFNLTGMHSAITVQSALSPQVHFKDTDGEFEGYVGLSSIGSMTVGAYTNNNVIFVANNAVVGGFLAGNNFGSGTPTPETIIEGQGAEGADACLTLDADDGDDVTDTHVLCSRASGNALDFVNGVTTIGSFSSGGNLSNVGTITSSATGSLGWSIVTGANTACTTTCTSAAVMGWDTSSGEVAVNTADATADKCLCAGAS